MSLETFSLKPFKLYSFTTSLQFLLLLDNLKILGMSEMPDC